MDIADFDYVLPEDLVAQEPLPERDSSRLMVLDRKSGEIRHHTFRELPDLLRPSDLVVVNRSKVFPARLLGRKPSGGAAEALLLRPTRPPDLWEALVRPGRRLRIGSQILVGQRGALRVRIESESFGEDGRRLVRLDTEEADLPGVIARYGHTPLPSYVTRPDRTEDRDRYQTVYAREEGSIAAPTAGLHFTPSLLMRLKARGIHRAEIVLHVGPGTFRPVRASRVEEHRVDPEPFTIPPESAEAVRDAKARGARVVAVGTTTVRALETAQKSEEALEATTGETDCVIVPGFSFKTTDALITNFHLPRSSLLLLVCAFAGREQILKAYAEAIRARYRFYSYGDAMLLL